MLRGPADGLRPPEQPERDRRRRVVVARAVAAGAHRDLPDLVGDATQGLLGDKADPQPPSRLIQIAELATGEHQVRHLLNRAGVDAMSGQRLQRR